RIEDRESRPSPSSILYPRFPLPSSILDSHSGTMRQSIIPPLAPPCPAWEIFNAHHIRNLGRDLPSTCPSCRCPGCRAEATEFWLAAHGRAVDRPAGQGVGVWVVRRGRGEADAAAKLACRQLGSAHSYHESRRTAAAEGRLAFPYRCARMETDR